MFVSGQNSNNSVRVPNAFMEAVKNGENWNLIRKTEKDKAVEENREPEACKVLDARELWDKIAYTACTSPDPGV